MERSSRLLSSAVLLLMVGAAGLARFSQNVRNVQVVGLSGSGVALGDGIALLILGFAGRIKP